MMIFYSFPINFSLKILNDRDLNDRTLFGGLKMIMTLHDRILGRNKKNDRSPHIEMSGRFSFLWLSQLIIIRQTLCSLSHAARYSERSSDSGQNADGYLLNCFPSVRFHLFNVKCLVFNVYFVGQVRQGLLAVARGQHPSRWGLTHIAVAA